jgi:hypothetical protein
MLEKTIPKDHAAACRGRLDLNVRQRVRRHFRWQGSRTRHLVVQ